MRTWIKWIVIGVLVSVITTLAAVCGVQHREATTLRKQVAEQSAVIDSLLARRMTVFDVELHVTDRSRLNVYGRYNKGTINVPAEKTYRLEMDSVKIQPKN